MQNLEFLSVRGRLTDQAIVIGIQNSLDELGGLDELDELGGFTRWIESAPLFAVGAVIGYCVLQRDAKSVRKLRVN